MAILNFETYTEELSGLEIEAAIIISDRLKSNVGKKMARTNKHISDIMKKEYGLTLSSARIRKIINHIRTKGILPRLIATSHGYFVSNDDDELRKYIYSLRQRGRAILHVATCIEDSLNLSQLKIA